MSRAPADTPAVLATTLGVTPHVAKLVSVEANGEVRVEVPGHGIAVARLLTVVSREALAHAVSGRELLVLCDGGDAARPIVVGLLEAPLADLLDGPESQGTHDLVLRAEGSITLACGDASLTLHADGRVVTRGVNVVSVASEQQRIQGAIVRIN